jgi:hypothetical protein
MHRRSAIRAFKHDFDQQRRFNMKTTTKLFSIALLALSIPLPAFAQAPNWSQQGDYYQPRNTIVQQPTAHQLKRFKEGDYYASGRSTVLQPTPEILNEDREGDYYAPMNGR